MKDIQADILAAAYAAVENAKLRGNRDVVALVIAQSVQEERDRANAHVAHAMDAIRKSGDGSVENIRSAAIDIVDRAARAIATGDAA